MFVNHFGELRSGGGSLAIVLCMCNERCDDTMLFMKWLWDLTNTQQLTRIEVIVE